MTYEEAIDLLIMEQEKPKKYGCEKYVALDMAINALAKQLPKKPINNGVKKCPNCGFVPFDACETITRNCEVTHIIHCEWCGQAIDYGSENK